MLKPLDDREFEPINSAYETVFRPNYLSIGLVVPLEAYTNDPVPTMARHVERVQLAEDLGFSAVWLRDVPFNVPSFGDAGQIYDPFVYLGLLAGKTQSIGLGVASIVLPLRHPAHVAKAAASVDVLSGGRLMLGVASGDRPEEYPAMALTYEDRGQRFRDSFAYIRHMGATEAAFDNRYGNSDGSMDMLPKPTGGRLPLFITGSSQQDQDWLATNGDGWVTYPRSAAQQGRLIADLRARAHALGQPAKPAMQSLYIDLVDNPEAPPEPIHLGFRSGAKFLLAYLQSLEDAGINHVALNLRFNQTNIEKTLQHLADRVLPNFAVKGSSVND